ncbi:putative immunity protein [Aneurinibacillus tyrosinisolvens]|uniref:putative immunity protein n=1 Tax=Aneurinibacillus tyrosinisolvens TaxID=1443435 RepID=UPI00063EE38E|nr:hypothetical protein [Aneurinibacillus tyrosinisolvens]
MPKQKFVDTDTKETIEEYLKVVNHQTAVLWATDCAEHVIHYFEQKYPQDKGPRKAIEAARSAGQSVATAHVFEHAIHASTYAVKSVAYATNFDAIPIANERTWQYQHLSDLGQTV